MSSAAFGDFVAAVNRHLDSAVMAGDGWTVQVPAVIAGLYRLVNVMSRLSDDLAPCDEVEARSRKDLRPAARQRPGTAAESVSKLCRGISVSSLRLRHGT